MDYRASRWRELEETSPSGRRLFQCAICGRTSPTPDKTCSVEGKEPLRCSSHDRVVLHRYYLPSEKGEGWAIVIVGSDGTLSAISDYGNYGHYWSHPGCDDFREFLLRAKEDHGYFVNKLSGGRKVYDGEKTAKAIREHILHCRRTRAWNAERAREEWDLVDECEVDDDEYGYLRWGEETKIDDCYEYRRDIPEPDVVAFVSRVLASDRFRAMLQADLAAAAGERRS